jgi:hypothetical protein
VGVDAFRRRERRLNAIRKALEEASMGDLRVKYAAIWLELDGIWQKIMAREREKLFAKENRSA